MKQENERSNTMKKGLFFLIPVFLVLFGAISVAPSWAHVSFQCPCLDDPDATGVVKANGNIECTIPGPPDRNVACKHLTAGDGFAKMADGSEIYIFGFHDVTPLYPPAGVYPTKAEADAHVQSEGSFAAETSAPTIIQQEGQEFYLTLSTVPMINRPDLFDPHTVHYHGFPNASAIFDGEPMSSVSINAGASITYYYNVITPGTFMYHCHVEATEHMQMGMLGNLFVRPLLDANFAYNHASTEFDVDFPIQITSMDPRFHLANETVQPLPFAAMLDTFPLINGRGYPDTINTDPNGLPAPVAKTGPNEGESSQLLPSLITATVGERILLRLSSLATVDFYSLTASGLPMQIIGKDAKIFRGRGLPAGTSLYQTVTTLNLGGGESYDVIIDTAGVTPGTYFLYSTNLNELTNDEQDFGGMMTEIVIQ